MRDAITHLGMVILGEYLELLTGSLVRWVTRNGSTGAHIWVLKGNFFWQVDTPVTIVPADHTPWSLGQGDIPLTDWMHALLLTGQS